MADVVADMQGRLGFVVDEQGLTEFDRGLESARKSSDALGAKGVALGTILGNLGTKAADLALELGRAAIAIGVETVTGFTEASVAIDNWAQRIEVAPEQLQRFDFAVKSLKIDVDNGREALVTWQENLGELARVGTGPAVDSLGSLGLRLEDLADLDPTESLRVFATALADLPDSAQRTSIALEVLGSDGKALLPLLQQGGDGIEALMGKADELGLVLDQSAIAKGKETAEAFLGIENTTQRLKNSIAIGLAPVINDIADRISDWYAANEEIIEQQIPVVIDEIVSAGEALIKWGTDLYEGMENLRGLFGRVDEEGSGALGSIGEHIEGLIGFTTTAIELFVEWTEGVAQLAEDFWDVADAVWDGLKAAYDAIEPIIDSVSDAIGSQTGLLSDVVDFLEGIVDRIVHARDIARELARDVGLGHEFGSVRQDVAEPTRRANERKRMMDREREYQDEIDRAEARTALAPLLAQEADERRKRGEKFQREALKAARGGGGGTDKIDIRESRALFGSEIEALARAAGVGGKAVTAALEAAAKSLESGANRDTALQAAIKQLESLSSMKLTAAGSPDAALFNLLTTIGGPQAARTATEGARFVRIDQSVNIDVGGVELKIPEGWAGALTGEGMAGGTADALQRQLVERVFLPIVEQAQARGERP